jgi:hypothetical protein
MPLRLLTATALAALMASPAFADALPDGTYICNLYSGGTLMNLGSIRISGERYEGPAYDGNYEGQYGYELTDAGTINWGGPRGGFEGDGQKIVSSVVTDAGDGNAGFDITIEMPSGNFTTVSCGPE